MLKHQPHLQIALRIDLPLLPLNVLKASCSHLLSATVIITNLSEAKVGPSHPNRNNLQREALTPCSCYFLSHQAENPRSLCRIGKFNMELFLFLSKGIYCRGRSLMGGQQMWTLWQRDRLNGAQCSKNILLAARANSHKQPCAAAVRFSCVTVGNSRGFVELWQTKESGRQQNWPDCKTPGCKMAVCTLNILTSTVKKFYNYRFITCPIT